MFGLVLTFLKPFNIVLVLWLILYDRNWPAAAAIMWLMICDIFDGFFFRRSSLASDKKLLWFRRVFDVAGDRVAIEAVLVIMIIRLSFPLYLYVVEGIREVFLLGIWLHGYRVRRPLREPNLLSRISTFAVGLMAMAWLTFPGVAAWLLIPVVAFGVPGARQYYRTTTLGAS